MCNPETCNARFRGTSKNVLPSVKGEYLEWARIFRSVSLSPKGQPLGWLKVSNMIEWTIVVGCTRNQMLRRSPILALFHCSGLRNLDWCWTAIILLYHLGIYNGDLQILDTGRAWVLENNLFCIPLWFIYHAMALILR